MDMIAMLLNFRAKPESFTDSKSNTRERHTRIGVVDFAPSSQGQLVIEINSKLFHQ